MSSKINFTSAAVYELDFLQQCDSLRILDDPGVVKVSAWRYEHLWLPLMSQMSQNQTQDLELLPPMDVYWMWHVHMLSPSHYGKDCKSNFGRVFNHELNSAEKIKAKQDLTRPVWNKAYPNHTYDLPSSPGDIVDLYNDFLQSAASTVLSYDITSASYRQRSFFYNVLLPHYRNPDFLLQAFYRYNDFLNLKKQVGSSFIVPCYDIDLVWHTHQVHPLGYIDDCIKFLGQLLPHDDTDADRSKGSKLDISFKKTASEWQKLYKVPYSKPGTMYRGQSSKGILKAVTDEENLMMASIYDVTYEVEKLQISFPLLQTHLNLKVIVTLKSVSRDKLKRKLVLASLDRQLGPDVGLDIDLSQLHFHAKTNDRSFLQVAIKKLVKSINVFKTVALLGGQGLLVTQEGIEKTSVSFLKKTAFGLKETTAPNLEICVVPGKKVLLPDQTAWLETKMGSFIEAMLPEQVLSLHESHQPEVGQLFKRSSHEIQSFDGTRHLTVNVLHSLQLSLSEVHVYAGTKMSMVAHLVDSNTIDPSWYFQCSQLKELNSSMRFLESSLDLPFKTMIVKDSEGDMGICFAKWVGFQPAVPPQGNTRGKMFSSGNFKFWFYDLRNNKLNEVTLNDLVRGPVLQLWNGSQINFLKGEFSFPAYTTNSKVYESVALAFIISTLYILVQPRPRNLKFFDLTGRINNAPYFNNKRILLLNCAGWPIYKDLPSNANLKLGGNSAPGGSSPSGDQGACGGCGGCGGCGSGGGNRSHGPSGGCGGGGGGC